MTDQRTFATFDADLLDDSEFSEAGDILVPGGRSICAELAQLLSIEGFQISKPTQHEFYGWEMTVERDDISTWILLQGGEPWLMIVEGRSGMLGWLGKSKSPSEQVLALLDATIKKCSHFSKVAWFTRKEYESGGQDGSPTP
jgi:hypothetical protein